MKNIYLKLPHHKIYKIEQNLKNIKQGYKYYLLVFNYDFLKKYFEINTSIITNQNNIENIYTNLSEEGKKYFNILNNYFYIIYINDNKIKQYFINNILPIYKLLELPDYIILSETSNIESDSIIISTNYELNNKLGTFISKDKIPISFSPFNNTIIKIKDNIYLDEVVSFGNEYNFTISFINNSSIYVSPNFNILETFKKIEEMDKLVNQIIGNIRKNSILLKEYNNYSMLSLYSARFNYIKTIPHVYSHFTNVLYDNGFINENGIGIIYDNVSYNTNDQILGSEFLYGNISNITTIGRWEPIPLPGGEIANIEPWRITLATLKESIKGDLKELDLPFIKMLVDNKENNYIFDAINKGHINYSLSSSMHHIISALGELLFFKNNIYDFDYFEDLMDSEKIDDDNYFFNLKIKMEENLFIIDTYELFNKIVTNLFTELKIEEIIKKLIISIVKNTVIMVDKISEKTNEKKVFLSGEIFKHSLFLNLIKNELENKGYYVYLPKIIPIDDSSISVGQLLYYLYNKKNLR